MHPWKTVIIPLLWFAKDTIKQAVIIAVVIANKEGLQLHVKYSKI